MASVSDDFTATANPIGAPWIPARNVNRAQVLTTGGHAFGTGTNNDGYAYLLGFGDSVIETLIFRDPALSDTEPTSYEFEHLHCVTDDAGNTSAYEADCSYGGGFNLVIWFGAASFAVLSGLATDANFFPDGAGGQWRSGYKLKTEVVKVAGVRTLNIYADSGSGYIKYFHYVLGADATNDAVPLNGDPAISLFTTLGSSNLLGFDNATVTNFDVPAVMLEEEPEWITTVRAA